MASASILDLPRSALHFGETLEDCSRRAILQDAGIELPPSLRSAEQSYAFSPLDGQALAVVNSVWRDEVGLDGGVGGGTAGGVGEQQHVLNVFTKARVQRAAGQEEVPAQVSGVPLLCSGLAPWRSCRSS